MYRNGIGVQKNAKQAIQYFQRSVELGDIEVMLI
jgi:TPR repeat protein